MNEQAVIVVLDMQVNEGRADEVIAAFDAAMAPTHAEEGCHTYALHRDNNDPNHLVLIEHWRAQADLELHMQTPHLAALMAAAGDSTIWARPTTFAFLSPLGLGDPAKGAL